MIYGKELLVIFLSYVLGCISTGYYLALFSTGKDIRTYGSTSTGARNVGRILGKRGFIITFLIDLTKGAIVAYTATALQIRHWAVPASLIAVLLGHIWPIQLNFRGGKGLSVTIGFLLMFDYWIVVWAGIVFCLCMIVLRKPVRSLSNGYELSAFIAIALTPLIAIWAGHSAIDIFGITVAAVIILQAHRQNIIKFLCG